MQKYTFLAVLIAVTSASSLTNAQGTALSPSTVHAVDASTNVVWIGGPNDTINGPAPYPIDLDATGGPWRKAIVSDPLAGYGGGSLFFRETIQNVGTEPWTDWHEVMLNNGSHPSTWGAVTDLRVNGTSISYTATVVGGTTLDLDNFSQPVLPGDILEIDKQYGPTTSLFVGPGTTINNLLQWPTTNVPEPSSLASVFGLAVIGLSRRRRK